MLSILASALEARLLFQVLEPHLKPPKCRESHYSSVGTSDKLIPAFSSNLSLSFLTLFHRFLIVVYETNYLAEGVTWH